MNITIRELIRVEQRKPEFYLKDFLPLPKKSISMISAQGGSGKSFLAMQLAIRIVKENENRKVLLWLSEDDAGISKYRAEMILNRIKNAGNHLRNLFISDDMPEHITSENYEEIKKLFLSFDIVILDPLIAFYGADENSNSQARFFMNLLNKIAKENLQSIVILHHTAKGENGGSRGASAFVDAVRLVYKIENIENSNMKKIRVEKDNFGVRQIIGDEKDIQVLPYAIEREEKREKQKEQKRDLSQLTAYDVI